ncbi:MAG: DUF1501 domain-containing protein [Kiritimatiellia bacterium]
MSPSSCPDHHGEGATPWDLPIPRPLKEEWKTAATRRHFLTRSGQTLGALGLGSLLGRLASAAPGVGGHGALGAPHHAARGRRVIQLFMAGGPPHMDLFDPKPGLKEWNGKDMPQSAFPPDFRPSGMTSGQSRYVVTASPWGAKQYGACGAWVSDLLPWTARCVDDIAMIHSMHTDAINHEPAILLMNTCAMFPGRPALGAWISYGLGSGNANLPSFVVLNSNVIPGTNSQTVTPKLWTSSFLPTEHAGVPLRSGKDAVLYLRDPEGMTRDMRQALVKGVSELNRETFNEVGDPETNARIQQYELAFRMQMSVPELSDFSDEPASTWDLYGPAARTPGSFAYNCLMARRLAERGVRYTQIYQRGWDVHGGLAPHLPLLAGATDRPAYALLTDLKQRGLLDETLVVWGGEFGRTIYSQGGDGRDHHARCFTVWLAGAGVKGGTAYGRTDEFAFSTVENPVHVRDLTSTLCHLLGIDANRLSKRVLGVDLKPFGVVPGKVVREILA